jgi:hypothetical protein
MTDNSTVRRFAHCVSLVGLRTVMKTAVRVEGYASLQYTRQARQEKHYNVMLWRVDTISVEENAFRFVVLTSSTYSQWVSRLFIFTRSHSDTHQRR